MAEIKQAKFIDRTGQEADAVFVGAEKAIYDDSGKRLDQKLEEREKATGLLASDTQGILGNIGAEVSLQSIIDKVAEKIMRELVSNSSLTQTLANYMTTAMMSGEQINVGNKVPTSALAFAMNQAITQNKNAITQLNSELVWKAGDSYSISNFCTAGFLTGSKTEVYFSIPLSKPTSATKVVVSDLGLSIRQNNSYIWGTATDHFPANKSVGILGDGYIVVTGTIDPKDNATNNDACGVWAKASISFQ